MIFPLHDDRTGTDVGREEGLLADQKSPVRLNFSLQFPINPHSAAIANDALAFDALAHKGVGHVGVIDIGAGFWSPLISFTGQRTACHFKPVLSPQG